MKTAVLLIDSDLGFVFWLGRALDQAGYEAFPAKNIPDAFKLIAELHLSVGLAIVNCSLPGAADFFANSLHTQRRVKIIGLVDGADPQIHPELDGQCAKPKANDKASMVKLFSLIDRVLSPNPLHQVSGDSALRRIV